MIDLPARDRVVVETPKGSRHKYKYDPEDRALRLGSVLTEGLSSPYDFGFVPSTRGEDGDPLDVLLFLAALLQALASHDAPSLDERLLRLLDPLRPLVPPARVCDKAVYLALLATDACVVQRERRHPRCAAVALQAALLPADRDRDDRGSPPGAELSTANGMPPAFEPRPEPFDAIGR